jgi:hypothetical protein
MVLESGDQGFFALIGGKGNRSKKRLQKNKNTKEH